MAKNAKNIDAFRDGDFSGSDTKVAGSRNDLKKYGIDTNYKGGDPAMDATIDAIKKDPEMRHMWGLHPVQKVKKQTKKNKRNA